MVTKDFFCAFFRDMQHADDASTRQWWLDVWMRDISIYRSNIYVWLGCLILGLMTLAPRRYFLDGPIALPGLCVVVLSTWQLLHDWHRMTILKGVCHAD
jgi:hypothetical protein